MDKLEKYLEALEAAVETKDRKAIELLDGFSAYVYHEIHDMLDETEGDERIAWEGMLNRVKSLISGMSDSVPGIWD